jgi:hypothetical protein
MENLAYNLFAREDLFSMVFHVLAPIKLTSNTMDVSTALNKTANGAI